MPTYTLRIALELLIQTMNESDQDDREQAIKRLVNLYEHEVKEAQR